MNVQLQSNTSHFHVQEAYSQNTAACHRENLLSCRFWKPMARFKRYIMLHHVASCYIMLITSCYINHVTSCYIMLHHVTSCYIMLHHVTSQSCECNIVQPITLDWSLWPSRVRHWAQRWHNALDATLECMADRILRGKMFFWIFWRRHWWALMRNETPWEGTSPTQTRLPNNSGRCFQKAPWNTPSSD